MTLLLLFVSAAFALFVLWPAFSGARGRWDFSDEDTPLGRLAARREVLVGNLADLDFEFAMGKVSEDDYRALRDSLKRQTLKIMEQMEVIAAGTSISVAPESARAEGGPSCGGAAPRGARVCPNCGSSLEG